MSPNGDANNVLINVESRVFYLSDEVSSSTIGKMCFNLLNILNQDDDLESKQIGFERKPIHIYINSNGGYIYDMWALVDIIENSKTPIYTYCNGCAMSAALTIYLSGHRRFAYKHSTFLFHQPSQYIGGKYLDIVDEVSQLSVVNANIKDYILEHTKLKKETVDEVIEKKKDLYINADDAVKYGIVDEII